MPKLVPYNGNPIQISNYDHLRDSLGNAVALAAKACSAPEAKIARASFLHSHGVGLRMGSTSMVDSMRRDWNYLLACTEQLHWNDHAPVSTETLPIPHLRLVGLHIRDLRAVKQLDLPGGGLGWGDKVPDLILLGGVNGSGKTTLLQFITEAFQALMRPLEDRFSDVISQWLDAKEAWIDFEFESYEFSRIQCRFLVGERGFIDANKTPNCWYVLRASKTGAFFEFTGNDIHRLRSTIAAWFPKTAIPSVLFFGSEDRTLVAPSESYKSAGKLIERPEFAYRWRRPSHWSDSLAAVLYSMRWEDLNAREEGRFTEFGRFEAYADAFRRFTGDGKRLAWEQAELVVRLADSDVRHDLTELSSGEKQVLLLSGEILHRWRPGSLILIDEPELHLHSTWQTRLYEALRYWLAERGGQVIVATQSSHLFHIAEPGTVALLGVESL